jgi:hypothetical protein
MSFAEPWDSEKAVNGRIIKSFLKDEREFLLIEDEQKRVSYLVAARYVGEKVTNILSKGTLIVVIYLIEESELSVKGNDMFDHLQYEGGGSISLIESFE